MTQKGNVISTTAWSDSHREVVGRLVEAGHVEADSKRSVQALCFLAEMTLHLQADVKEQMLQEKPHHVKSFVDSCQSTAIEGWLREQTVKKGSLFDVMWEQVIGPCFGSMLSVLQSSAMADKQKAHNARNSGNDRKFRLRFSSLNPKHGITDKQTIEDKPISIIFKNILSCLDIQPTQKSGKKSNKRKPQDISRPNAKRQRSTAIKKDKVEDEVKSDEDRYLTYGAGKKLIWFKDGVPVKFEVRKRGGFYSKYKLYKDKSKSFPTGKTIEEKTKVTFTDMAYGKKVSKNIFGQLASSQEWMLVKGDKLNVKEL